MMVRVDAAAVMRLGAATWLLAVLSGCASVQRPDPLEAVNRKVFAFNEGMDRAVLAPLANAYEKTVPSPARTAVRNFLANPGDLWSAANLVLQGKPGDAASAVMRFAVNSVFGIAGLIDIATPAGLPKSREDLGQTLGVWGVANGAYIVWPFLGSSTLRDSVDIAADASLSARAHVNDVRVRNQLTAVQALSARADLLPVTRMLGDISLDRYVFVRDAYLQRRLYLVYDGNPPEDTSSDLPE